MPPRTFAASLTSFLSEEVTCTTPDGTGLHMGVYDITERDHIEIQRRRNDLPALFALLRERRIFYSINHPFSSLTGTRTERDFTMFRSMFPAMETQNSLMLPAINRAAAELAGRWAKSPIGGSDAHAPGSVGAAYTTVPGARNRREFLEGLRLGRGQVSGESGNWGKLTRDVWWIGRQMVRANPWTALAIPLAAALPVVTLTHFLKEAVFAWYWTRKISEANPRLIVPALPAPRLE